MMFPVFILIWNNSNRNKFGFESTYAMYKFLAITLLSMIVMGLTIAYFTGELTYRTDMCRVKYINSKGEIKKSNVFEYNVIDGTGYITFDNDSTFKLTENEKNTLNYSLYDIINKTSFTLYLKGNFSDNYFPVKVKNGNVYFNGTEQKSYDGINWRIEIFIKHVTNFAGVSH